MLACKLDVDVRFDPGMTILSALVAVIFTFIALSSPYAAETIENSTPVRALCRWNHTLCEATSHFLHDHHLGYPFGHSHEGYSPLHNSDSQEHISASVAGDTHDGDDTDSEVGSELGDDAGEETAAAPNGTNGRAHDVENGVASPPARGRPVSFAPGPLPTRRTSFSGPHHPGKSLPAHPRTTHSIPHPAARRRPSSVGPGSAPTHRAPSSSAGSTTSSASEDSEASTMERDRGSSTTRTTDESESSSVNSWNEPLRHGLSREARLRIKARAKDRPVPHFGWRYWARVHWESATALLGVRAAAWAGAIVFMHYCGALVLPRGARL